jgi:CheY-like chemotaxis protein/HPt (histidine-containing phosphotransfer) domain-containing protein
VPGHGSTFHFTLLAPVVAPPAEAPAEAAPPPTAAGGDFPLELLDAQLARRLPLRVLLAEDNAINQLVALRLLGRLGYQAEVAHNGREALEEVQRRPYDVVLMDVQMPEMDGLEATRRIRAEFPFPAAPGQQSPAIIAMTANAMRDDRDACLAAGMQDYLSKPIRVEALIAALSRYRPQPSSAAAHGARAAALDAPALRNLELMADGDAAFVPDLIATYLRLAPRLLDDLRQAAEGLDASRLTLAAHSLKSNSKQFGAALLAGICSEVEALGRAGRPEKAVDLIQQAEAEYGNVRAALEEELNRPKAGTPAA